SHTNIPNVELLSGAQDSLDVVNLSQTEKLRLLENMWELNADYLIFDLGAGTNLNTIDFFAMSDVGFVVLLPEPTSIENAYRFLKCVYYRRLKLNPVFEQIHPFIEIVMDPKNKEGILTPADLFRETYKKSSILAKLLGEDIAKFLPKLIVNQTRTQSDIDLGHSVKTVCKKYFDVELEYVGPLTYDPYVWHSIRKRRPVLLEFPNAKFSEDLQKIAYNALSKSSNIRCSLT
ncbi:MAG: MinD/ParA family protein, partial [Bdellovibrio sp.]|nr:MinD/ParA family protein [Bdellovibrio sp.]